MKIKSFIKAVTVVAALSVTVGCTTTTGSTQVTQGQHGARVSGNTFNEPAQLRSLSCSAPVVTVSLSPMQCRTGACQSKAKAEGNLAALIALANEAEGIPDLTGFGDGMTDMLTSALASTGCFDMLDRELMAELAREQQLSGREVSLQGADLLATGAITSLSFDQSRSNIGGGFLPVIGGVTTSTVTAKIGMDVRIVDVNTGRVAYTKTYHAESGKRGFGVAGGGLIGSGFGGGSHRVKGGVEMEEAAREIIMNVTNDMVEAMVPEGSYKIDYLEVARN